ncbi:MAG TPA: V-type ATP synthase subunit E [Nitrosopumilaceae archaeon]
MNSDPKLEKTIDKILNQTEIEAMSSLKKSFEESLETLSKSQPSLEQEYDRIIDEGKKEAEKIEKQIIGSSDLESRNKQILLIEDSVQKVLEKAIQKIGSANRDSNYSKLMSRLLEESTNALGTSDVIVYVNSKDKDVVKPLLAKFSGAELSQDTIDCLGGVEIKSKDGSMTFNNTIDATIDRMKPLIRKEIAKKFGIGN